MNSAPRNTRTSRKTMAKIRSIRRFQGAFLKKFQKSKAVLSLDECRVQPLSSVYLRVLCGKGFGFPITAITAISRDPGDPSSHSAVYRPLQKVSLAWLAVELVALNHHPPAREHHVGHTLDLDS